MTRNVLALSLFALSAAIVYASTPQATAQTTAAPECKKLGNTTNAKLEKWIAEQTAAGRSQVISIPNVNNTFLCAW
ncbi:MAG: hypothetical protein AAGA48_11555 [Myxococcota bacterium]